MDEEKQNIMCRICLRCESDNMKCKYLSLFEKSNNNLIVDRIRSMANVEIQEGDGLPDRICPECLLELETAVNFKKKCEISNAILQSKKEFDSNSIYLDIKREVPNECEDTYPVEYEVVDDDDEIKYTANIQSQALPALVKQEVTEKESFSDKPVKASRAVDLKLECHDCGGFFPSKCKLRVHWKRSHIPKLVCVICKRLFKSYKAYHYHLKKQPASCKTASQCCVDGEGKSRIFHCKSCQFKSRRAKDMKVHLLIHTGDRPFKCDKCPKTFTQQGTMQDHMEMCHKIIRYEYTCQHCGKYIKGRHRFYSHMRIHKDTGGQCDICKKQFATKLYLATHMLRHSTKQCACEYCAATFYTRSELINHIRQSHKKLNKYSCDICGYKASSNFVIKRHKLKHTDTNIPCMVCGMFVEDEQLFKVHEKRHLEKPHSCPHCDSKFHTKKNLSKHVRLKHVLLAGKAPSKLFVKRECNLDVNMTNN